MQEDSTQTGTFTVTVEDQEAPLINEVTAQIVNQSPFDRFADVILTYTASDNCTLASNQVFVSAEGAVLYGSGQNTNDWQIISDHHLKLSAVPLNGEFERRYSVRIASTDASGNQTLKNISVHIPTMTLRDFMITAAPNPSNSSFNISMSSAASGEPVRFKLMNAQGVILESVSNVLPGQTIHIGNGLRPGVYYLEAIKSNTVKSIKLVKI